MGGGKNSWRETGREDYREDEYRRRAKPRVPVFPAFRSSALTGGFSFCFSPGGLDFFFELAGPLAPIGDFFLNRHVTGFFIDGQRPPVHHLDAIKFFFLSIHNTRSPPMATR